MGPDRPLAQQQAQLLGIKTGGQSWRITLLPGGEVFECSAERPLLDAAHAANLAFPYSCRGGRCGTCRGRLLAGEISYPRGRPEALDNDESAAGYALFCSAHPVSDLTIELATPTLEELEAIARRKRDQRG